MLDDAGIGDICQKLADLVRRVRREPLQASVLPALVEHSFDSIGKKRTLTAPRRCATGIRIGDFAGALDKTLRQRSKRTMLDYDEPDRRGRRRHFHRQDFEVHSLAAKTHDRGGDETKPTPRFDHAHVKMQRHRHHRCRRSFKAAPSEHLLVQRPRQAARLRQHPRLSDKIGKRQVSPLGPMTLGTSDDHIRFIKQRLRDQVGFGHRCGKSPEYQLNLRSRRLLNCDVFRQNVDHHARQRG
jgi:hypothetical protein